MKHQELQTKPFIQKTEYQDRHGFTRYYKEEYWCQGNLKPLKIIHGFQTYECQTCHQTMGQRI